ncbi:unnamed protein product [Clavelina lepadiformis]|uniref:E3 ubiquitin-protein ligase ZSWIM2 n=1 Tax=Clavelina lepadiformis TaxID=159417 RepID=A0ABP0GG63_CLALP
MSRSVSWQRAPSDAVSWRQDQALSSTIYILREIGPTSFLLKEDGAAKKVKASLGDPHLCNCSEFKKERSPCKHICWLLLKKFKLNRQNELSFQLGLVEREINEILRGPRSQKKQNLTNETINNDYGKEVLKQRDLTDDDVCPICQEPLLENRQPVTFCRYGCGNSVHIKCMKIWADHQKQTSGSDVILCPFCREEFGDKKILMQEFCNTVHESRKGFQSVNRLAYHLGTTCQGCRMMPIQGNCYQCTTCVNFHLCNTCYHLNHHRHHAFVFRIKKSQRWRPAPSRDNQSSADIEMLIGPIATELQSRDITENDYDMLLQLDRRTNAMDVPVDLAGLPEHLINKLPTIKVREGSKLLFPGRQCRLCLRSYMVGQFVRRLPECGHIFHRSCVDDWLKDNHRRCPIDRQLVFDPNSQRNHEQTQDHDERNSPSNSSRNETALTIPGVGIIHQTPKPSIPTNRNSLPKKTTRNNRGFPQRERNLEPATQGNSRITDFTFGDLLVQANAIRLKKSASNELLRISDENSHVSSRQSGSAPSHSYRSPNVNEGQKAMQSGTQKRSGAKSCLFKRRNINFTLNGTQLHNIHQVPEDIGDAASPRLLPRIPTVPTSSPATSDFQPFCDSNHGYHPQHSDAKGSTNGVGGYDVAVGEKVKFHEIVLGYPPTMREIPSCETASRATGAKNISVGPRLIRKRHHQSLSQTIRNNAHLAKTGHDVSDELSDMNLASCYLGLNSRK